MISNEELSSRIRSNPVFIGCLVACLALGGAIYFRSDAIPKNEQLLSQMTTEGARLATNVRNGSQLPEQLAALTAAIGEIDQRLIRRDELATNLQYFYRLEAETGIKLVDLRQGGAAAGAATPSAKGSSLVPVPFNISVQGDFVSLLGFLRKLENGVSYSRVVQASVAANSTDRAGPLLLQLSVESLGQP